MGREVDLSLQIYMGYKTIVSAFDRYTYWSFKRKLILVLLPIYYVFCLYTCTYILITRKSWDMARSI